MSLGKRIKEQQKKSGLSQEKAAEFVGVSRQTVTRTRQKKNVLFTLTVVAAYVIVYFAGRIFGTTGEQTSVIGWLFGDDPKQLSYLYGWLLHQNIFWIAMAVSVIPALFGKKYFSFITLAGFVVGLLIGELWGYNPAGAAFGYGHYGWLIWCCIFAFSIIMGIIFETFSKNKIGLKSQKLWAWLAVFAIGIFAIVLIVRMNMPTSFI